MIPPVAWASSVILPPETASSRVRRKVSARPAFLLLNESRRAFACRFAAASAFLTAVLLGDLGVFGVVGFRRNMESDSVLVLLSRRLSSLSEWSKSLRNSITDRPHVSLRGECRSIQSFASSWFQKASTLSRCGVGGIRTFCLVGDWSFFFDGLEGGVLGRMLSWRVSGTLESKSSTGLYDMVRRSHVRKGGDIRKTLSQLGGWRIIF